MSSNNPFADNPYASPAAIPTAELHSAPQVSSQELFRDGNLLVTTKTPSFPPICLVTNEPTDKGLLRRMTWHHPALYLTILAGILIYAILALILQKRATLYIPLAKSVLKRRFRMIALGWLIVLTTIGMVCGTCLIEPVEAQTKWIPFVIVGGPIGFVIGALVGMIGGRTVYPAKIDDHFVWLKGVSPEYLKSLPQFPWVRQ